MSPEEFSTDFRAVVIAAALIESGVEPADIVIRPAGGGARGYSKDVTDIRPLPAGEEGKEYVCLTTSREGIYDMLPEGVFHRPDPYSLVTGTDSILAAVRRRKQEEREARRFFLPFESEIYFLRIMSALSEYRVDKRNVYADLVRLFVPHWEVLSYMELWQANVFLEFVPHFHSKRGDFGFLQRLLSLILRVPVDVRLRKPPVRSSAVLGGRLLGVDMTAGSRWEDDEEVHIVLGPLDEDQAAAFLPGGRGEILIERLAAYVVPADMEVHHRLEMAPAVRTVQSSVLGYTSYLPVGFEI